MYYIHILHRTIPRVNEDITVRRKQFLAHGLLEHTKWKRDPLREELRLEIQTAPSSVSTGVRAASLQPSTHDSNTPRPALELCTGHTQLLPSSLDGHTKFMLLSQMMV